MFKGFNYKESMKTTHTVNIILEPILITKTSGKFTLTENTIINFNPVLRNIGDYLIVLLLPTIGFKDFLEFLLFSKKEKVDYKTVKNSIF